MFCNTDIQIYGQQLTWHELPNSTKHLVKDGYHRRISIMYLQKQNLQNTRKKTR